MGTKGKIITSIGVLIVIAVVCVLTIPTCRKQPAEPAPVAVEEPVVEIQEPETVIELL